MSDHTLEFPSDLVDGARQGDEAALKALTERAYPVVHRFGRWSKRGTPWRPTISHRTCWFR